MESKTGFFFGCRRVSKFLCSSELLMNTGRWSHFQACGGNISPALLLTIEENVYHSCRKLFPHGGEAKDPLTSLSPAFLLDLIGDNLAQSLLINLPYFG